MAEPQSETLREEFNRWAEAGRGDSMEQDHLPITLPVLSKMRLAASDNVLDVGCGSGWLSRRIGKTVSEGRLVGMDISDEMIRIARRNSADQHNLMFMVGEVAEIPWQPDFFSHVISVESAYYWPNPAAGIKEIFRVLQPGGSAWMLINYYRDNPHAHQWGAQLAVPTHLLSAEQWSELFRQAGCATAGHERIVDPSPSPDTYTGRWFRDAAQVRAFKAEGALLVHAVK